MARKAKKKAEASPPAAAVDDDVTEQESVHEDDGDVQMNSADDDIPEIVDRDSDADGEDDGDAAAVESKKCPNDVDIKTEKKGAKANGESQQQQTTTATTKKQAPIPFMDTFFQLSSEESPNDRSIAARDLIHHCLLNEHGVNHKDAAYALTRLMNGLCTGRAASRQGFASCLSSFLRVVYSPALNNDGSNSSASLERILKDDAYSNQLMDGTTKDDPTCNAAMVVRQKLLSTTQFLAIEATSNPNDNGRKKNHYGGKMKEVEKRDHSFGRLFGILAVVRSGILGLNDFPSEVSPTIPDRFYVMHSKC
jgi:hypothetical protein